MSGTREPQDDRDLGAEATALLAGKAVTRVVFHRPNDLMIEFEDMRLYVNTDASKLEISVVDKPSLEAIDEAMESGRE